MMVTSSAALIWQLNNYIAAKNIFLSIVALLLLVLALYMSFITIKYFIMKRKDEGSTEAEAYPDIEGELAE
jgi:hypothetical protein